MTATRGRPVSTGDDTVRAVPTAPMRIYAADHQPIRLLAELEGVSSAELVRRAVHEYMRRHADSLAQTAELTRDQIRSGSFEGLANVFEAEQAQRRRQRAARLSALGTQRR